MRLVIPLLLGLGACMGAGAELPLLPQPQELEELAGDFALRDGVSIAARPAGDIDLRFAARLAAEELGLKSGGRDPDILVGLPGSSPRFATVCREGDCMPDEALGDQGYVLLVSPERVLIAANAPAGAFYGVQTLLQLAEIGGGREIPCVRIRDWPALKWRGILTDQSRQAVPKVETYKRLIRELSRYKINFVSMHLEHTFVVEKHPIISEGTGALTAAEVRELCDYARRYHCLFFPSFEAFAHQHHILKHDEHQHLAESPGGSSFAPSEEGTYELLADIFDEMCPAFTGTAFFNAGCDEVGDLGAGKSKGLAEEIGKPALYARHMNRVHDLLAERGKRMMMWGDMLLHYPEAMDLIPKDTIIMDWHYGPAHDYPSIAQFREKGFEVFVVPALSSWVRLFPDYETAQENIEWLIRRGREGGATGSMTCNWGDDGNENLIANCYYGWLFAAECSWGAQAEEIDRDLFDRAFCRQFFGTNATAAAQATHLLSQANRAISRDPYFNQRFFHDDPFKGRYRTSWPSGGREWPLWKLADEARRQIAQAKATRNRDVLSAMRFAGRRQQFVAEKSEAIASVVLVYEANYYGEIDPEEPGYVADWGFPPAAIAERNARAPDHLDWVCEQLQSLLDELATLRRGFVRHWDREFRPQGIGYALGKFDAQLRSLDEHIAEVAAVRHYATMPEPPSLDLDDRRMRRELRARLADLTPTRAPWAVPDAPVRVPVQIAGGGHDRVNVPLVVKLPGHLMAVANLKSLWSARLVIGDQTMSCGARYPHILGRPLSVAFILPGPLNAGETVEGNLYLSPELVWPTGPPAVETAPTGRLIRTGRYEALVGQEGGHVFAWRPGALGGRDIAEPGTTGWSGFFDDPRYRTTAFDLYVEMAGPPLTLIRAKTADGYQKEFYFWEGSSYAECVYSEAADHTWAFDSTANFAADSPMPGTAYLSNGFAASVPASAEQRQVPEGGQKAWWCCKTRADGLTLGLITPLEQTNMMVGPGGGWGGVGIERSNPAQYFVVFADVDPRGPAAVEEVYHTLARDDPITVTFGEPEERDKAN